MIDGLVEGRHVFFEDHDGTHAAVVTKVWSVNTGLVNLCVFAFDGSTYPMTSVYFQSGPSEVSENPWLLRHWRWMFSSQPTALTGDNGKYNK